jgi:hypothetical protein
VHERILAHCSRDSRLCVLPPPSLLGGGRQLLYVLPVGKSVGADEVRGGEVGFLKEGEPREVNRRDRAAGE